MRLWFDRFSEVSLRVQILTQIKLGILSGELGPEEKLPSVRALARRFGIHSNTVSAAYAQLRQDRWVLHRPGSGVYVRSPSTSLSHQDLGDLPVREVERMIQELIHKAELLGVSRSALEDRFLQALHAPRPKKLLLIEPDPELSRIVCHELRSALSCEIDTFGGSFSELKETPSYSSAEVIPLVLPSKAESLRHALHDNPALIVLQISPVAATFAAHLPASREALVGVASCWPQFLEFTRVMLRAAGFPGEALVLRSTSEKSWKKDLQQTDAIICDALTASQIPRHSRVLPFTFVAESSLRQLRSLLTSEPVVAPQKASQ